MARKASLEVRRQWRRRLGRFARSKSSVAEFCRREQVSVASFYQWRKKLAGTSDANGLATKGTFLPVQVTTTAGVQVSFPNGALLTLPVGDPQLLPLLIEAIAQASPTAARTTSGEA